MGENSQSTPKDVEVSLSPSKLIADAVKWSSAMHTVPLSTFLYEIVSVLRKALSAWVMGDRPVASGRPVLVRRKGNELQVLRSTMMVGRHRLLQLLVCTMYYYFW